MKGCLYVSLNKKIKGVVSVGSKFHAPYTAEALYRFDMLQKFIAGKKFQNNTLIPQQKIMNISLPHYIAIFLRKLPIFGHKLPYNIISDALFDVMANNKLSNVDFFIGFNNFCLSQMKTMKKKGAVVFLEQRIAHVQTEIDIYTNEFGSVPSNLSKRMVKRKLEEYEIADYILVPSTFVYDSMVKNGVNKGKLILIPYGYDPKLFYIKGNTFSAQDESNKPLRVIFVGQIGFRKGIRYLLEAISKLHEKGLNIELTLVGNIDKNFIPVLERYAGSFVHRKFVPQSELVEIYNNSDLFIIPSLCEGSALVTYEAAACGLPLVVTENTGSVVTNGHDGVIVKVGDTKSIEDTLEMLYYDKDFLNNLKANVSQSIKNYTWEKYSERLVNAINNALDKSRN